jgi:tRNA(Arg) A34 adenosine deaminase TadA
MSRVFDLLKTLALTSPGEGKHRIAAAVLDNKGTILSTGVNSYIKTHPLQAHYARKAGCSEKQWLHAEISALVKVKHGKPNKIVVIRINRQGELRLAKPCDICMLAIKQAGINSIEFSI